MRDRLERFLRREFEDVVEEYQDEVDNLLVCKLVLLFPCLFSTLSKVI